KRNGCRLVDAAVSKSARGLAIEHHLIGEFVRQDAARIDTFGLLLTVSGVRIARPNRTGNSREEEIEVILEIEIAGPQRQIELRQNGVSGLAKQRELPLHEIDRSIERSIGSRRSVVRL